MHCPGVYQAAYQSQLHFRLLSATTPPPETHVKNLTGWGVVLGGRTGKQCGGREQPRHAQKRVSTHHRRLLGSHGVIDAALQRKVCLQAARQSPSAPPELSSHS